MTKTNKAKREAIILRHFDINYGVDETKLEGWQRLCVDVGIAAGSSITQCKKALKATNVNIHDLVSAQRTGQIPQHFPSRQALRNDLKSPHRRFPLKKAKANRFLSALLIEVWG